jgi:hypothetical protein
VKPRPAQHTPFLRQHRWALLAAGLFFVLLLALGFALYDEYGIAWDEPTQVELGIRTYRYVMKGDDGLLSWRDRSYGPFFEILLVAAQSQGPSRALYLSRHLLNFLFFAAGAAGLFALGLRYLRSPVFALLACLMLVLSPRIFADAFYNSKDIPFLVLYIFALLTLLRAAASPGPLNILAHALFSAALVATRIPGLFIPALTLAVLLLEALARRISPRRALLAGAAYLALTVGLVVLFWPALWPDPPGEFLTALQLMVSFPHETQMLYLGSQISSLALPWHYIPVWIGVTTPLPYVFFFGVGLVVVPAGWFSRRGQFAAPGFRDDLVILSAVFAPLLAVILLRATLYDGWRQMFFIYAPMLLLAAAGMRAAGRFLQQRLPAGAFKLAAAALLVLTFVPPAVWMAANHPYQNVYFNRLAGTDMAAVQQRFPLDYWGLAYREGLEYLLHADPSDRLNVYVETVAGQRNAAIFPTDQETRLHFVSTLAEADYFIGNYYNGAQAYPFRDEIFNVSLGNARILSVYRLAEEEKT